MSDSTSARVRVWDLPTRVFHWGLAISFFGAYLLAESERVRHLHVMFGYTVMALIAFRLLWGFIGTRYARFAAFRFGPRAVLAHLRGMKQRRVELHVGHTPAGSWAIWIMLVLGIVTGVSGWLNLNEMGGEAMEEIHEIAANLWMLTVFVHVAGVIVSSVIERQNLPRAMITGYKKFTASEHNVRNFGVLGGAMVLGIAMFWFASASSGNTMLLPDTAAAKTHLSSDGDSDDD